MSPLLQCRADMLQLIIALSDDSIAGYRNLDGPGAMEGKAEYGVASPFFLAALRASSSVYMEYVNGGVNAAASRAPSAAVEACDDLSGG